MSGARRGHQGGRYRGMRGSNPITTVDNSSGARSGPTSLRSRGQALERTVPQLIRAMWGRGCSWVPACSGLWGSYKPAKLAKVAECSVQHKRCHRVHNPRDQRDAITLSGVKRERADGNLYRGGVRGVDQAQSSNVSDNWQWIAICLPAVPKAYCTSTTIDSYITTAPESHTSPTARHCWL